MWRGRIVRMSIKDDIERYVHVPLETRARCVAGYTADANDVGMHVCGACGLRDPTDRCELAVDLDELDEGHWLEVGAD